MLHGIRVLDLTRFLPGGYCTLLLADFGAEVIKIEEPKHGDPARTPHPTLDPIGVRHALRNRAKKSVTLNLADPRGQDVMQRLVGDAHVLVEGFRPGVAARLGVGFDVVHERNPSLVYCSISGYGQDGPYRDLPGHDINYMAYAGALSVMARDGTPEAPNLQVADIAGGMLAAAGILAALVDALRTGRGRLVDISLTDAVISTLYLPYASHVARAASGRAGNDAGHASRAAYGVYETADRKYLTLGIANERHFWVRLCRAIGREDLADDAYLSGPKQGEARAALAELFRTRTRDEWFEVLRRCEVPCAPVHDLGEIVHDSHARSRRMFLESGSGLPVIGCPVKVSGQSWELATGAPALGQHTNEILGESGLSQSEVEALRADGVV
jgi:crotonobetainyl-CoA:carnitine CoA-transferase CaiB-like acyl-CoA transferase